MFWAKTRMGWKETNVQEVKMADEPISKVTIEVISANAKDSSD